MPIHNVSSTTPSNLRPREAAEYLRTSERTLARWRNLRSGPPWARVGKAVVYRRVDLDTWLANNTIQPLTAAPGET